MRNTRHQYTLRCVTAQEGVNSATDEATRATAQAEFERSVRYLKTNEAKLKDFCRQTGQDRDRFREQVLGFNKSTAQKAVHAAKRQQTANQTAGNVPSGHAMEVTPPTQKDNSSTGKTY